MNIRELINQLERIANAEGDGAQVCGTAWTRCGREMVDLYPEVKFKAGDTVTDDEAESERKNDGTAVRVIAIT